MLDVHTLINDHNGIQLRIAIIAKSLSVYDVEILTISKMRLADQAKFEKVSMAYIFYLKCGS